MTGLPVLDVGGTHVTASTVDTVTWRRVPDVGHRLPLRSDGSAEEILATLAASVRILGPVSSGTLAVAMPGPFDYAAGIGRFHDVGKFDALSGVDVRQGLLARLPRPPADVAFVNDAEAFGLGEWYSGAASTYERAVAITLGSGVGSAFVAAGRLVSRGRGVPPGGHVHRIKVDGHPLEEIVSRRAIIAAYRRAAPTAATAELDVHDIAGRAVTGDEAAGRVIRNALYGLGAALAPWLTRFGAQVLVVGGGMAGSWSLIEAPLHEGLGTGADGLVIVRARDTEASTAIGAARHACEVTAAGPVRPLPDPSLG